MTRFDSLALGNENRGFSQEELPRWTLVASSLSATESLDGEALPFVSDDGTTCDISRTPSA